MREAAGKVKPWIYFWYCVINVSLVRYLTVLLLKYCETMYFFVHTITIFFSFHFSLSRNHFDAYVISLRIQLPPSLQPLAAFESRPNTASDRSDEMRLYSQATLL